MASMTEYQKSLEAWQKAYPYIVNKSTGIKLGDYEDAHRKFQKVWAGANPYSGTPLNWSQWDAGRIEQGYTPTAEDYQANREYGDWEKAKEEAWSKMLTPEQLNEYYSQKHDSYKKHQRMGQMAFLAAAGAMAAPGLIGMLGAEGAGVGGAGMDLFGGGFGAGIGEAGLGSSALAGFGEAGIGATVGGSGLTGLGGFGTAASAAGASGGSSWLTQLQNILKGGGSLSDALKGIGGSGTGGVNWLNLLGNLGGGLIQSNASGNAANAQLQAGREANALLREMWQQGREDQKPYREAGTSALAGIQALLKDPSSIAGMPDYQFGFDQGNKALANSAAARGMTYSGQQGKALQRYGQDYAGSKLNESYNRLAALAGVGQQAVNQTGNMGQQFANNLANNIENQGNTQGSAYIGRGNAWNQAIGGALNGLSEQSLIEALLKGGG